VTVEVEQSIVVIKMSTRSHNLLEKDKTCRSMSEILGGKEQIQDLEAYMLI
jgi:hypothetical protein